MVDIRFPLMSHSLSNVHFSFSSVSRWMRMTESLWKRLVFILSSMWISWRSHWLQSMFHSLRRVNNRANISQGSLLSTQTLHRWQIASTTQLSTQEMWFWLPKWVTKRVSLSNSSWNQELTPRTKLLILSTLPSTLQGMMTIQEFYLSIWDQKQMLPPWRTVWLKVWSQTTLME